MSTRGEPSLLELLERHRVGRGLAHPDYKPEEELEQPLWEQALLGPAREFLRRPGKRFRARLVASSWALCGRDPDALPPELPLALELLHAGSLIVDDIQDDSARRRGAPSLHRIYGIPVALNTGNWLYFWSLELIARTIPDTGSDALFRRTGQALMHCHQGQALDIATRVYDLPQHQVYPAVHTCTALKTGALMELAAYLGACAAQADETTCRALARFGHRLGTGLQRLDDLGGLVSPQRRDKAIEDLTMARLTWPWAWLARTSDARGFAEWQTRGRLVADPDNGRSADELADELADDLALATVDLGRRESAEHLRRAFDEVRDTLGDSPAMNEVEREIQRMETSYG